MARIALHESRIPRLMRAWLLPICDPLRTIRGLIQYPRYLLDMWEYRKLEGAENIRAIDSYPQLHDRTGSTPFDPHYFYLNAWAMRRVVAARPNMHVDVASHYVFPSLLGAVVPTLFVDYRPLNAHLDGCHPVAADIRNLPFKDGTIQSLSCLHVAEHIGLGRYGDALDPGGTRKAARQLAQILAPGGNLFFAVPVGKPRLCFNAHRIHSSEMIVEMFQGLTLLEFSGVDDRSVFRCNVRLDAFRDNEYACGMFWFRKPLTD